MDVKLAGYAKLCSGYEYGFSGARGESGLAAETVRGRGWGLGGSWEP